MATPLVYLLIAGAAAVVPLLLVMLVSFLYAVVKTCCFHRRGGWRPKQVPHKAKYEFYHCSSVDLDSQKVLCCLCEKGVDFEEKEFDFGFYGRFEYLEDPMLSICPFGMVPTLVHEGHPISGVEGILSHMGEKMPGPSLMPDRPKERQEVSRWILLCDGSPPPADGASKPQEGLPRGTPLGVVARLLSMPVMARAGQPLTFFNTVWAVWRSPSPLVECQKMLGSLLRYVFPREYVPPSKSTVACFSVVKEAMDLFEQQLSSDGRKFLTGDSFTLADICVCTHLRRLEKLGLLEMLMSEGHPATKKYWERIGKREGCRRALWPTPIPPKQQELERAFARFRKVIAEKGISVAYEMDEDREEEED